MVENRFKEKRLPWPWSVSGVRFRPRWVQKTQKKFFFSKFWVIEPQILKIWTNFSFCSEKVSATPCYSPDYAFLKSNLIRFVKKLVSFHGTRREKVKIQQIHHVKKSKNFKNFFSSWIFFPRVIFIVDFKFELRIDKNFAS